MEEKFMIKKKNKTKIGIRFKVITMFIILITLPIIAVGYNSNRIAFNTIKERLGESSLQIVKEAKTGIETYLNEMEKNTKMMAKDANIRGIYAHPDYEPWMINSFKAFAEEHDDITNIYIGTKDKNMYVYPSTNLPSGFDPTQTDWYKEAISKKSLVWIDPYVDTATGKMVVTIATPVYNIENPSEITGVFGIDISLEDLSKK